MSLLLHIIVLFIIAIGGYYAVCYVIKLWTNCDFNEAQNKLHAIINGNINLDFENDSGFAEEVWQNVRNIIGEKRFQQLYKLSVSYIGTPLLSYGFNSGLPYIAVSLLDIEENEKKRIEAVLVNLTRTYLKKYGFDMRLLVDWKQRYDLDMPFLELRYAKTKEQRKIIDLVQSHNREEVIAKNSPVYDEELERSDDDNE